MEPVFRNSFRDQEAAAQFGLNRYYRLTVPDGSPTDLIARAFSAIPTDIETAHVNAVGSVAGPSQVVPTDSRFCDQYNLHNVGQDCDGQPDGTADADIDAPEAWALTTGVGGPGVNLAIIDNGVMAHQEFADRIVGSYDATNPSNPNPADTACFHGTHVAGVAAAAGNDGFDIAGINWGVNILRVKVLDGCVGTEAAVADGIVWAADNGAQVMNISLQFCVPPLSLMRSAVQYAESQGVLIVAAAGNNTICGIGNVAFPARFPEVIAVSGTTKNDEIAAAGNTSWRSNHGPEIEIAAPGDLILSSLFTTVGYARVSGTSPASPHVAGVASLVMSYNPELTAAEVREVLRNSADDLTWDPVTGLDTLIGPDEYYGYGRVNAFQALVLAGCEGSEGAACDDGLYCTVNDTCTGGQCVGDPRDCGDAIACTDDSCDEDAGECVHITDDTTCDDGLWCNGSEFCDSISDCQAGTARNCDDNIGCTDDSCNEDTDECVNVPNDSVCDDGLFCNGTETCHPSDGCLTGSAPSCDDGTACTDDACDEVADMCLAVPNDDLCDDGLWCNGVEFCDQALDCQAGASPDCNDVVDCTHDSCDELLDECVSLVDDAGCDDGLWCNGIETCGLTGCQSGINPCLLGSCDEGNDECVEPVVPTLSFWGLGAACLILLTGVRLKFETPS